MGEELKTVNITGVYNKYKITSMDMKKEPKKRVVAENWCFPVSFFENNEQLKLIQGIKETLIKEENLIKEEKETFEDNEERKGEEECDKVSKIIIQQINKKISGYKQQDIIKSKLDKTQFITFQSVVQKMVECELKCYYCRENMNVLYDISRELKQWTVDRIDNDTGHNVGNFHLACLDCNLKRRRRTDDKYLFTKQMNIVKQDNNNNNNNNNNE
jgi:hypothetical protein